MQEEEFKEGDSSPRDLQITCKSSFVKYIKTEEI